MRLLNPTEDELNAAFAEKVAGWTQWTGAGGVPLGTWNDGTNDRGKARFTRTADAVLPWLEKAKLLSVKYIQRYGQGENTWEVGCWAADGTRNSWNTEDRLFPRAAVIALLRAHGVEIKFTP